MSFGEEQDAGQSFYSCQEQCPQPLATSCNEPCVVSCPTSRVIIFPPPVLLTFPGPIISTCPQKTIVESSPAPGECGPAPGTPQRAEVLCSEPPPERFTPNYTPQHTRRCSYVFSSQWIHPCNRPSYRCYQPSQGKEEEDGPGEEKPETENTDTANEDEDDSEV